jgi:hypothetical protein
MKTKMITSSRQRKPPTRVSLPEGKTRQTCLQRYIISGKPVGGGGGGARLLFFFVG